MAAFRSSPDLHSAANATVARTSVVDPASALASAMVSALEAGNPSIARLELQMEFSVSRVSPPDLLPLSQKNSHTLHHLARSLRVNRTMPIDRSGQGTALLTNRHVSSISQCHSVRQNLTRLLAATASLANEQFVVPMCFTVRRPSVSRPMLPEQVAACRVPAPHVADRALSRP